MIANHKGEIPFVILLLPFLAGIALGLHFSSALYVPFLEITLISLAIIFILLNIAYKQLKLYQFKWLGGVLVNSLLFLLGWVIVLNYSELNHKDHFSKKTSDFQLIRINNEPKLSGDLLRFTATVEENVLNGKRTLASGTLLITIKDSLAKNLYYGDELLVPSSWQSVDPPFNPAEFNYKKYLANQNIHYQDFLYPGQYHLLKKNTGNSIIAYSLRLRQRLVEKFKTNMHNPEAIAVASTLILGYKADLSNDVLQAYSKTGTIHVLSVSGAHVAIIFVLLSFSLSFLDRFRYGRLVKAITIIILIWYYSLLTGFSPAVCRAAVMITMVIIGKTYNRHINTLNILALSAFFLLLYDPLFITDVGFQLSYLAVFGLIVLQPVVYNWLDLKNKWADKLWALCSVSIAAQVITFPLSVFYFHQFPVYFLVSNLFIVIPSVVIMYAGLAYLLLPSIPFISPLLAFILEKTILLMNKVLTIIEHTPYAGINKIWITIPEYLLLYGIIISLFYFLYEKRLWLLKLSLCFMLLLAVSISLKRWNNSRSESITFLSLRKHTGIVFKKGDQAVVLSDLSDTDKNYRYSVQPYLDSCQVGSLKIVDPNSDVQLPYLAKKGNFIQFENKKILLFNKQLQQINLPEKIKSDYVYVSDNPKIDMSFINRNYGYDLLIIDNTNSNALINRLEEKAKETHINYRMLRRNKSVTVISN
ncbi:MAG TPA: ComEC/Rec2 family competence protein [Mucilaginibacter sp.]|nr:ComEC/Rec2 family competence protein [Mucilaginibacter sp.]